MNPDTSIEVLSKAMENPVKQYDATNTEKLASHISAVEVINPIIRFTKDQIVSILHKTLLTAKEITGNEFKSVIETLMIEGANPMTGDAWPVKIGGSTLGIWWHYEWLIRKARELCPSLTFGRTEWGDEHGKWFEIWPYDPKAGVYDGTDPAESDDGSRWIKKAPFIGRVWYKTIEMVDFEPVTLYWHERAKYENEWKKQPLHMMEKCLKAKAIRLVPKMGNYYIREEAPPIPDGEWQPPTTFQEAADGARTRSEATQRLRTGDLRPSDDLPVDAKDKSDLKLMFKDLGLDNDAIKPWCNEVLKACDLPAMGMLADLTKGQAEILMEAGREEIKSRIETENAPEGSAT